VRLHADFFPGAHALAFVARPTEAMTVLDLLKPVTAP
jgi:hypothetical protein